MLEPLTSIHFILAVLEVCPQRYALGGLSALFSDRWVRLKIPK